MRQEERHRAVENRPLQGALFAALEDSDPCVRGTAAIALARIEPENSSTVEKVMPFLIEDLTGIQFM